MKKKRVKKNVFHENENKFTYNFKKPRNEISFLYSQKKYFLNKFSKLETDTL
jgi:hypothetical protein